VTRRQDAKGSGLTGGEERASCEGGSLLRKQGTEASEGARVSQFKRTPVPYVIERLDEGREIKIQWEEQGHVARYPARFLRLACQCAGCVEEMSGQPVLDPDTVPGDIRALGVRLVGQYAVYFAWDDGHSTGIYPYEFLLEICPCDECVARREAVEGASGAS
jgi:DUF971 family protein